MNVTKVVLTDFNCISGDLQGSVLDFGHTTISNLMGDDETLWTHTVIAILLFPLGIILMRHFSVGLRITMEEHGDGSNDNSVESRFGAILFSNFGGKSLNF